MNIIAVGLGGAIGAVLRYFVSLTPVKSDFPAATLITNLLGAVVIGFIVGFADRRGASERTMLFLQTGVCGGFTTFSTFSLEAYNLFQNGNSGIGVLYIVLSVGLCILGVFAGKYLSSLLLD